MQNTWYLINGSKDDILTRLQNSTVEVSGFFGNPPRIKFLGQIRPDYFKLSTLNIPQTEFEFKVLGNQVYFSYKKEDVTPITNALVYALFLPLVLGFILYALLSKDINPDKRADILIGLPIVFLFCAIVYPFLSKKSFKSNDHYPLTTLSVILQADLEPVECLPF